METMIDGVLVENSDLLPERKIRECIRQAAEEAGLPIAKLRLTSLGNGEVQVEYETFERKFERIRRITGYLVGTIDRWNDAKRAEESQRVKHL